MLPSIAICILFATVAFSQNPDCLDGCVCDQLDAVIRCDHGSRTKLQIPETPLYGYKFIALTCNQIEKLPSEGIIKAAFPDIQGIDVQGNVDFASSVEMLNQRIALSTRGAIGNAPATTNGRAVEAHIVNEKGPEFKATLKQKYEDSGAKELGSTSCAWRPPFYLLCIADPSDYFAVNATHPVRVLLIVVFALELVAAFMAFEITQRPPLRQRRALTILYATASGTDANYPIGYGPDQTC
ncbi:unnamed protein product, partial [Mesorhabditis spiculigera]